METNKSSGSRGAQSQKTSGGVKAKSDAATELRGLFESQLKDLYWVENTLLKAIPKMVKNCSTPDLVKALESHLRETKEHVSRLEEIFETIQVKPIAKKCLAMEGLIEEAEEMMKSTSKGMVRDAAIIAAAQKIEHYEIATYGTLCSFANTLRLDVACTLLGLTLIEEKEADSGLTSIAEARVNLEAANED